MITLAIWEISGGYDGEHRGDSNDRSAVLVALSSPVYEFKTENANLFTRYIGDQ
ncbi:hypothetical protein NQ317_011434 [Molorchus minor]|uniref:Uncharacterized protein n=1 Tax=Molorchus minor TaxID=1323400 RepID=A0ABQ9IYL5_9CUCU|nr:hypothetical protein NQ317_011434 [Molorchus minor]